MAPGLSWNHEVDGVKTHLSSTRVFKISGKNGYNGSVEIKEDGGVDLDFYGTGQAFGDWLNQKELPDANWTNLFNSKPFKPAPPKKQNDIQNAKTDSIPGRINTT